MVISFSDHIAPVLAPYRANMMWRFDVGDYATVKAYAHTIYGRLSGTATGTRMPPPPTPPLDPRDVHLFAQWIADGCAP